jgi:3-deoxy-D-arabino-heptulosonate 7-phosphate (DAHP) synthase
MQEHLAAAADSELAVVTAVVSVEAIVAVAAVADVVAVAARARYTRHRPEGIGQV